LPRVWRERDAGLRVRGLGGGYILARFDLFGEEAVRDVVRASKLRSARGLVLDLRNNGGGEAEAMTDLASAFLPAGQSLGWFTDRAGRVRFEPRTRSSMLVAADRLARLQSPVVIITSERTASAAEIFVRALRQSGRTLVIGAPTCGCVLAVRSRHALPDGGELDVSEMDYHAPDGARLEGAGVVPDETIKLDLKDLRAGRDTALERAVQLLKIWTVR
jgi:carboxyl-terminal processing protease